MHGFRDFDKLGLCPIFQDGFELGRYGVLACRHIMHLDCRVLSRRMGMVFRHLTAYRSAPFATLGFGGLYAFVCDRVVPLWAKIIWFKVV